MMNTTADTIPGNLNEDHQTETVKEHQREDTAQHLRLHQTGDIP